MTVNAISSSSTTQVAPTKAPETTQEVKPPPPPPPPPEPKPSASVNTSGQPIGTTISTTA